MTEEQAPRSGMKRSLKRFLTPSQKYEVWLQLVRQEVTMADAATAAGGDRSTIVRIRQVAKDGALAALAAANAEIARLSEAIKEMPVKLTFAEGEDGWA